MPGIEPKLISDRNERHLEMLAKFYRVASAMNLAISFYFVWQTTEIILGKGFTMTDHAVQQGIYAPPLNLRLLFAAFCMTFGFLPLILIAKAQIKTASNLTERKSFFYCKKTAWFSCFIGAPHGTILGILTLSTLKRPEIITAFQPDAIN